MNAIVIDDEYLARRMLIKLLTDHFPQVSVIDQCKDGREAVNAIIKLRPDLVFLDVQMPGMNGFEVLDNLPPESFKLHVIFVTSYNQYAIKAIKYAAFDYLLKPINEAELINTMQRLEKHQISKPQVELLNSGVRGDSLMDRIAISHQRGLSFMQVKEIIMMTSYNNYTQIYIRNRESVVASKTLGYYAKLLDEHSQFFRCHKQYLINLDFIKEYRGGDENTVVLEEGLEANVSRSQRKKFLQLFRS